MQTLSKGNWQSGAYRGGALIVAVLVAISVLIAEARASEASQGYSEYEQQSIDDACMQLGLSSDPAPEGKRIGAIHVVTLEVFERRDPVPRVFNIFHLTTREHVVRSELLFREGERFAWEPVDESARALRLRKQLSLVLVVPVVGKDSDTVDILVITKDVWSLRLNWGAQVVNDAITELVLQPAETNLFGTHTLIGGLFTLQPDVYSAGAFFSQPRIGGSRLAAAASASAITNRKTGSAEGSFGSLYYGSPLYSLSTKWGWLVYIDWFVETDRLFNGTQQAWYDGRASRQSAACGPAVPGCMPYEYRSELMNGVYELARSFGQSTKYDLSVGADVARRQYLPTDAGSSDPALRARFRARELPVSDMRASPFVQFRSFRAKFVRLLDYNTLGLQEDVQVGHDVVLRLYPASKAVASTRDLVGSRAAVAYTLAPSHSVLRYALSNEMQVSGPAQSDARVAARAHLVTPPLGIGRALVDVEATVKYQDYFNRRLRLGGNTRLRGYLPDEFIGKNLFVQNFEFRARPFDILSAQIGAVLFHDMGDAVDSLDHLVLKHAVGAGVRVLFPQLDRAVFRADWGVPLVNPIPSQTARGAPTSRRSFSRLPGQLYVSFEQAFGLPTIAPGLSTRPGGGAAE